MVYRRKFTKKLTPQHQEFINKYLHSKYNRSGLYKLIYFCEDEDIAIVIRYNDYYDTQDAWGCVNMSNQLLVPFEYRRIWDYGRFLIARKSFGTFLYDIMGNMIFEIGRIIKSEHKAYNFLFDKDKNGFKISVRKMMISKKMYKACHVLENGLLYLTALNNKVGLALFSKLKLPFEYESIAIPQNGYTLAIKESLNSVNGKKLYDCLLMKVRSQIKTEGSIHPTGINLFTGKTWDDVIEYFNNKELFETECNSIICYNEKVNILASSLEFYPFDKGLPNLREYDTDEDDDEDDEDTKKEYYNPWENYSYEEAMYDALGGEMDAIWNIE